MSQYNSSSSHLRASRMVSRPSWLCACCCPTWALRTPMKLLPGQVVRPPPPWGPRQQPRETSPWMALLAQQPQILPLPWMPRPCANSSCKACSPCLKRYCSRPTNPRPSWHQGSPHHQGAPSPWCRCWRSSTLWGRGCCLSHQLCMTTHHSSQTQARSMSESVSPRVHASLERCLQYS
jgi:hypothetical protein